MDLVSVVHHQKIRVQLFFLESIVLEIMNIDNGSPSEDNITYLVILNKYNISYRTYSDIIWYCVINV